MSFSDDTFDRQVLYYNNALKEVGYIFKIKFFNGYAQFNAYTLNTNLNSINVNISNNTT